MAAKLVKHIFGVSVCSFLGMLSAAIAHTTYAERAYRKDEHTETAQAYQETDICHICVRVRRIRFKAL